MLYENLYVHNPVAFTDILPNKNLEMSKGWLRENIEITSLIE